jgi:predicted nucleic acid-binding protein
LIFDSDILIEFLNKNPAAAKWIARVPRLERNISAVSYLEVLYGCRDKEELDEFQRFVATALAEVIALNEPVSRTAVRLMERYVLARRLDTGDALIAATALERGEALATANVKHFDFIPGLAVRAFLA